MRGVFGVTSPALSADGAKLFVGSGGASSGAGVYALKATDGSGVWKYQTGSTVTRSTPALSPDGATLFVGSDDGNVYALTTGEHPHPHLITKVQDVSRSMI